MAEWNSLIKKVNNNKTMSGAMNVKAIPSNIPATRSRGDTMNDLKQFFNPDTPLESRAASSKSGRMDVNAINQIAHQYALKQLQGTH